MNSIAGTLGFENKVYSSGIHESTNNIDIEKVNTILIHCNFVTGSYINGVYSQVLYSFTPHVDPGYKIIEIPKPQLYFHPVVKHPKIDRVRIWLTDQNNRTVDLRGEKITVTIQIREADCSSQDIRDIRNILEKYFLN